MQLDGASAVVTGGASGIGRATAEALVAAGALVTVWDRDAGVGEVGAAIGARGERVDVSDSEAVRAAALAAGPVSLVAHCAAMPVYGELATTDDERWDRAMAVNLRGAFLVLRETSRAMIAGRRPGRIVLVSSANGVVPDHGLGAYGVAKAGVNMLAKVAAVELAAHGILVNALLPGPTMTPMAYDAERQDLAERMLARLPVKRFCAPSEVAEAIVFLLRSDWVTGANMAFDGGMQVSGPIDFWELLDSTKRSSG